MAQELNLWGEFVTDTAKELQLSGSTIVFGLNESVVLSRFEYTTKTGTGGAEGNAALDIAFTINGSEKNTRIYEPGGNGIVYNRGKKITDKNSPEYLEGLINDSRLVKGLVTHYLKALGISEEALNKNLTGTRSFKELVEKGAKGASKHLNVTPLHLFSHFQASIKGSATQTYLEGPENLVYGPFLCPAIKPKNGSWEAQNEWTTEEGKAMKGLRYVDGDNNVHPFIRDKNYMESNRAKVQNQSSQPTAAAFSLPTAATTATSPAPTAPAQGNDTAADDDEW